MKYVTSKVYQVFFTGCVVVMAKRKYGLYFTNNSTHKIYHLQINMSGVNVQDIATIMKYTALYSITRYYYTSFIFAEIIGVHRYGLIYTYADSYVLFK